MVNVLRGVTGRMCSKFAKFRPRVQILAVQSRRDVCLSF